MSQIKSSKTSHDDDVPDDTLSFEGSPLIVPQVSGTGTEYLVQHRDLRMLYLRVFSELQDKLSIWDYLRVLFCRLRPPDVVCGTDRYQETIKIQ